MCEIILFIFKIIFSFYFVAFPGFIRFDWFLASQSQVSDRKCLFFYLKGFTL